MKYIENVIGKKVLTASAELEGFSDCALILKCAKDAVASLNANGIMQSMSQTEISPFSF